MAMPPKRPCVYTVNQVGGIGLEFMAAADFEIYVEKKIYIALVSWTQRSGFRGLCRPTLRCRTVEVV
jgi:hypothetical protein